MSFQILPLSAQHFAHLRDLDDAGLAAHRARRETVTSHPGFPCRVSLADAELGEEVILTHFTHHDVDTPFHASHAIYIRPHAQPARLEPGEVPMLFRHRMMSLRGFDANGLMIDAGVSPGTEVEAAITSMLANRDVATLHLHYAGPGCYAARVERVTAGG